MGKGQVITKSEIIKNNLSRYLNIDESSINISKPMYDFLGFRVDVEIKFEIPGQKLRTFQLEIYSFSINQISEEEFKFENQCYSYNDLTPFLKKVSDEIQNL